MVKTVAVREEVPPAVLASGSVRFQSRARFPCSKHGSR
jgi:hypothetical protein